VKQVVIENPVINSPLKEPSNHFRFTEEGITDEIVEIRTVYSTNPNKCHISHVVADTGSWEQKMASALEEMEEVRCYVKNYNLGFSIPYTINGEEKGFCPKLSIK
jgi:hypothetical protein